MWRRVEKDSFLAATGNILNAQETITVTCTTIAAAKGKPEKKINKGLNRTGTTTSSALSTELSSQLGAGHFVNSQYSCRCEVNVMQVK